MFFLNKYLFLKKSKIAHDILLVVTYLRGQNIFIWLPKNEILFKRFLLTLFHVFNNFPAMVTQLVKRLDVIECLCFLEDMNVDPSTLHYPINS